MSPTPPPVSENIKWHHGEVDQDARFARNGHKGAVVWLTGLSGSGKSTVGSSLEGKLFSRGCQTYRLDGDNVRHGLCSDLGFSAADRAENIRRAGNVAALFADAGLIVMASFVSPYRVDRNLAREAAGDLLFLEVHVNCPLNVCEQRDPKGLYKKARAGTLASLTGISAPYEAPNAPDIDLRTDQLSVDASSDLILNALKKHGVISS